MRSRPLHPVDTVGPSPAYTSAVTVCIESSHALLDIFISMDISTLRAIPVIVYTRMFYAVVVLTKLGICAQAPYSDVGRALDIQSLQLTAYLQTLLRVLQNAAGRERFNVSSTFLLIVMKVVTWYRRQLESSTTIGAMNENLEPMEYLKNNENAEALNNRELQSGSHAWGDDMPMRSIDRQNRTSQSILNTYATLYQAGTGWTEPNLFQPELENVLLDFADFDNFDVSSFMNFENSTFLAYAAENIGN